MINNYSVGNQSSRLNNDTSLITFLINGIQLYLSARPVVFPSSSFLVLFWPCICLCFCVFGPLNLDLHLRLKNMNLRRQTVCLYHLFLIHYKMFVTIDMEL